jgi:pyridinium-3,5-biscarboxylic acid mononucleotide synthase
VDNRFLKQLLREVEKGSLSPDDAMDKLRWQPTETISDFARLDHHRALRQSMPEFIYAASKTPEQVAAIMSSLVQRSGAALASRATESHFKAVQARIPDAIFHPVARLVTVGALPKNEVGQALVIAAGTADVPVAEEAAGVLRFLGDSTEALFDVGVAGIHRLLEHADRLQDADVLIVVAGMEGALPSVVGGLVDSCVIAVPTSVGYGASFGGLAALLGMLNSCASGLTVVNIDNGLGAAAAAHRILTRLRLLRREEAGRE